MSKDKVIFKNNPDAALKWLANHRGEKLYDVYGNYVVHCFKENIIEEYTYSGDWEDEDGNIEYGDWDVEKYTRAEFLKYYRDKRLETI